MGVRGIRSFVVATLAIGAVAGFTGSARAEPGDIGFQGPSYLGVSGSHPSGEKPESKLWHHDGIWWGSLWSSSAGSFNIHRLDPITHVWIDTGTVLETVGIYRQDVLFDGTKAYVASHRYATSGGIATAWLTRLSYSAGTEQWTVDPGFPAAISNHRSETLTIDKDSTGRLWATWTRDAQVWVNHTNCSPTCSDASWATPFQLSSIGTVGSAASTNADDISSVVAFGGGRIGVFWSNQNANAFYFAVHNDSAPTSTWSLETARSGTNEADDHINIATDGSNVFVAVKTSFDLSDKPETYVLKRTSAGAWSAAVTSMGTERFTRPIVTYDQTNDELHWFAADVAGGKVYTKSSGAASPSFATGTGTAVMWDASANDANDPTSTKQAVDPSTGLVVLATDNFSKTYWHHEDDLAGSPQVTAGFTATPQSGEAPVNVQFTDTSTGSPTSWSWNFGDGGTSAAQSPSHTYTTPGVYTVTLTVSGSAGSDSEVKAGYITVIAPQPLAAAFSSDPSQGAAPLSVQFTDESLGNPTSWSWTFGDGATSTQAHPTHVYNAIGSYDVSLTVTNDRGESDTTTVVDAVVVSGQVTLNPVADAFVRSDRPTTNYGGATFLRIREATGTYRSLLKFDVQGIGAPPVAATLRLRVEDPSNHAGDVFVVDNSWTELGVTDANAPSRGTTADALGGEAVFGTWHEWDVTSLINGDGSYSFMLVSTSGNSAYFPSREGANAPELVITPASSPPLTAGFSATPLSGVAPLSVQFTDQSSGPSPVTSWAWDFGDGSTSGAQNPSHQYTAPGTYTVSLTVGDGAGTDGETKTGYVVVSAPLPLTAGFSATPLSGVAPLSVQFTDQSSGPSPVTSWLWDFGDGSSSVAQNPSHVYASAGSYTVSLTVGDGAGTDGETKLGYVVVSDPSSEPITFIATEDAYVRTDRPDSNRGSDTWLRLRQSTSIYESLLKFDVTGLAGAPSSVVLRLYVTDESPSAGAVASVNPTEWNESTVTYNNRPAATGSVAADQPSPPIGQWVEWDVTSAVTGNGSVSFKLTSSSGNSVYFSSREGTQPPQLVITP